MVSGNYKDVYDDFVDSYKKNVVDGEDVGMVIMRMVQQFAETNVKLTMSETSLAKQHEKIIGSTDDSGKAIAANKAEVLLAATDEARLVREAKADLKTIEHMINALKSLQKGILNE